MSPRPKDSRRSFDSARAPRRESTYQGGGANTSRSAATSSGDSWIWGLHSVQAAIEECPDLILEVQLEEGADPELRNRLKQSLGDAGLKGKEVKSLPKFLAEKRSQGLAANLKNFPTLLFGEVEDDLESILNQTGQAVVLDAVQDPRNYGAILRSAAAFGIGAVFVGQKDQSPLTGVVAQTSAGNVFRLKNISCRNLGEVVQKVRDLGFKTAALDGGGQNIEKFLKDAKDIPVLWVLGSEGAGLRKSLREKCEDTVKIPMSEGVESLNVSAAATLAFYLGKNRSI